MRKLSPAELTILVQNSLQSSADVVDIVNRLVNLDLQLTRWTLQSLCQMAEGNITDGYIRLIKLLYAIRKILFSLAREQSIKAFNELKSKIVDELIGVINGNRSQSTYAIILAGPSFVDTNTYANEGYSSHTLFRGVVSTLSSFAYLYPQRSLQNVFYYWFTARRHYQSQISESFRQTINTALEDIKTGNNFYIIGSGYYAYFSILGSKSNYLNLVRAINNARKLILDNKLRLRLLSTIIFTLLQLSTVDLKVKSYLIGIKGDAPCIYAKLAVSNIKDLNTINLLTLLTVRFGTWSLSTILPIAYKSRDSSLFNPNSFWSIGFCFEDKPLIYYSADETLMEQILLQLRNKLNPIFIKEGLCVEGG